LLVVSHASASVRACSITFNYAKKKIPREALLSLHRPFYQKLPLKQFKRQFVSTKSIYKGYWCFLLPLEKEIFLEATANKLHLSLEIRN
jgi:hypothetical protein